MRAHHASSDIPGAELDMDEIVHRYTGMLDRIGHRYRLTPQEREDAVQSTWLALCRNAEQIRDPQCVAGWLATTMRRFSAAALRHRQREYPVSDSFESLAIPDEGPDVVDAVAARHATHRLRQAIARLPERERRLIELQLDPAEPGYVQISRSIPMPMGSIGPVRGRALRRLRVLLTDLESDDRHPDDSGAAPIRRAPVPRRITTSQRLPVTIAR